MACKITRQTVLDELIPYFEDERYYLLLCDVGYRAIDNIKRLYPKRVINCGIAEQATVGIASGMARSGLIPIISSIASFLVFRALEQIRVDIILQKTNVKLIGSGSGDYFKFLDRCHWCEDYDEKLLGIIGLPVYDTEHFKEFMEDEEGGYLKC
jgi:transketolase